MIKIRCLECDGYLGTDEDLDARKNDKTWLCGCGHENSMTELLNNVELVIRS